MAEEKQNRYIAAKIEQVPTNLVEGIVDTKTSETYTVSQALAKVLTELNEVKQLLER